MRWLADDNFTFLGYREYDLVGGRDDAGESSSLVARSGSGLGILRSDVPVSTSFASLPAAVRNKAREQRMLVLTKADWLAGDRRAARERPAVQVDGEQDERRGERIVRARIRRVDRERECRPCVGEHDPEPRAPKAATDQEQQHDAGGIEHRGRRVRRLEIVPAAVPRPDQLERHIRQVEQGPVGVAVAVVGRERAVQLAPMGELVRADHARVADVDDVAVDHVQAGREADEEQGGDTQPAPGHHQLQRLGRSGTPTEADPQQAHEQVRQQRRGDRHRHPEVRAVEEEQRAAEADEREQIRVQPAQRRRVDDQHEQHAQRHPDPGAVAPSARRRRDIRAPSPTRPESPSRPRGPARSAWTRRPARSAGPGDACPGACRR